MPSAKNLSPKTALITEDFPALNSPTMTIKNNSSNPLRASRRSFISSNSDADVSKKFTISSKSSRSLLSKRSPCSPMTLVNCVCGIVEFIEDPTFCPLATGFIFASSPLSPPNAESVAPIVSTMAASVFVAFSSSTTPSHPELTIDSMFDSKTAASRKLEKIGTETLSRIFVATETSLTNKTSHPSFAAISAFFALSPAETTTSAPSGIDFLATTVGTPSVERTTPSISADDTISVLSTTNNEHRCRKFVLIFTARL